MDKFENILSKIIVDSITDNGIIIRVPTELLVNRSKSEVEEITHRIKLAAFDAWVEYCINDLKEGYINE